MSEEMRPIPAGRYVVRVRGAEVRVVKNSGQPYVMVQLAVEEGEHRGRLLWRALVPGAPGSWVYDRWDDQLSALGIQRDVIPDDTATVASLAIIASLIFDRVATVDVRIVDVRGFGLRNDVRRIMSLGEVSDDARRAGDRPAG